MYSDLENYEQRKKINERLFQRKFEKHLPPKELRKDNKCWNWQGGTLHGYGRIRCNEKILQAHRVSYEIYKGKIPLGLLVRHTCDNRKCVNPKHLLIGTGLDNLNDMCKRNKSIYEKGKLNSEAVKVIKWMLKYSPDRSLATKLASLHNVTRATISNIKRGRTWAHITI